MMTILTILLDTNVILRADKFRTSIHNLVEELISEEYEIVIHPYVEAEVIKQLNQEGNKSRLQATFAMRVMAHFSPFLDDHTYPGTDTALLVSAKKCRGIIFTFDRKLKKRCLDQGVPVITTFNRKKFVVLGSY